MTDSCSNCRWWLPPHSSPAGNAHGECHQAPPWIDPSGNSRWPHTLGSDFCGGFTPKIQTPPPITITRPSPEPITRDKPVTRAKPTAKAKKK